MKPLISLPRGVIVIRMVVDRAVAQYHRMALLVTHRPTENHLVQASVTCRSLGMSNSKKVALLKYFTRLDIRCSKNATSMYGRILYLNLVGMKQRHGADGGTRTHTLVRKGILSPLCLPFHHVSSYWAQPVIEYLEWDIPGNMGVTQ